MGKMAVRTLADRINGGHQLPVKISLPYHIVERASCMPCARLPETCRRNCAQHISPLRRIYMPRENHCGECCCLKGNIEERACQLALYIIENKATVRSAAQRFGISKSTVHKDLSERLPAFNKPLYLQVKQVLDENKAERHIRGGIATRKKYRGVT